ncbi:MULTISPECIES: TetR family transcriptional regulator [unclassified Rhodococcus (in: high G+C Gram-positive bacteria)]|uniref:TetR family transcriptional regulator n=1 Tax=unclassified Rhodococcus (in: high G+C Gram-positive bacteria) TaxID=192944 RepID=UPI000B9C44CD|nr:MULTISPECIES: TetR family transcriptional regulator [unclassified Rhodococcus (in: high G+C Gram-positive bacteria)]OZE40214.1 TetR family transcriptional regulator [Rhodococcus sp. 05-2254-4]OZE49782.1 TetR family transcriptional regulator [Rhodococcus sp. 05-2254-3]OZE50421.1 TetR family transcriptional regulator [Rhodococcus sp. 05-2254-2]
MGDSTATRARLLAAATEEFATHGIAGARVDRIAAEAKSNKSLIYSYFGNKDALFDIAFDTRVDTDIENIVFTPDDLPGYAVRLYEMYLDDPTLVRLLTWARLERTPAGPLFDRRPGHDDEKYAMIADAQRTGLLVDDVDAADIWSMLIALAGTWAQAAIIHTADRSEPEAAHDRRRAALAATVRRAFCRSPG